MTTPRNDGPITADGLQGMLDTVERHILAVRVFLAAGELGRARSCWVAAAHSLTNVGDGLTAMAEERGK